MAGKGLKGLRNLGRTPWCKARDDRFVKLWNQNVSLRDLQTEFKFSSRKAVMELQRRLRRLGAPLINRQQKSTSAQDRYGETLTGLDYSKYAAPAFIMDPRGNVIAVMDPVTRARTPVAHA